MGLDTTDMVEIDGCYVAADYILINKNSLFNTLQTRQYHVTYTVANGQKITIGFDNSNLMESWAYAL